jgi:hypothetical protein
MSEQIKLRGTELLTIQYLMNGINSGVSYDSFQLANIDSAGFTGSKEADLHGEDLVQQASQSGELYHLSFHRRFDNPVGEDYTVQVKIYDDGHFRTTKPVEPHFLDELVEAIDQVMGLRRFLTPLGSLIEQYVYDQYNTDLPGEVDLRIGETKSAFRHVVTEYFSNHQYQGDERHIYEAIIANLGIHLNRISDLSKSDYPSPSPKDDFPNQNRRIQEFFNDYATTVDGRTGHDFNTLSGHLHNVLNRDWETPIEMLEYMTENYDI